MLESLLAKNRDSEDLFSLRYLKMSPHLYRDFINAHKRLEEEFLRRAIIEMRKDPKSLLHVRLLTMIEPGRLVK